MRNPFDRINPRNPAVFGALMRGDLSNALTASTPGGIEAQEKAGQDALNQSGNLPLEILPSREAWEALGFTFGEKVDDLFQSTTLPAGWLMRPTDHSMWSEIVDEAGAVRAKVFYKAAFYDRRAFARLVAD